MPDFASCSANVADITEDQFCHGFGGCGGSDGIPATAANLNGVLKLFQEADNALAASITSLIARAFPVGGIIMWSGSSVPSGWALCNGQNGTPDLRNRFVMGAGTVSTGSTGGNATHNHGITVSGHALNEAEIPAHRHAMFANVLADADATGQGSIARGTTNSPGEEEYIMTSGGTNEPTIGTTGTSGNGNEHSHDAQSSEASSLPPFYALAFIMKV